MPFRFPSWAWTLNPLIRQTDASNNQPGSSRAVGNDQNQPGSSNAADPHLLGFPPGTTVRAAPQRLIDATRLHLQSLVQARSRRRPFIDGLRPLNLPNASVDPNSLPVMTRTQFQEWWDNQDQLVFTTFLRTQEHHLLSTLTLTEQLIEAEQNVEHLLDSAEYNAERIEELEAELEYGMRRWRNDRDTWESEKTVMKMEHNDELEIEWKKIKDLQKQLSLMKSLKDDLDRCNEKLAEQDEVNSNGELLYPMLVVLDRFLNRAENERPSARQTHGNKRDGGDPSGELPPKRKDKKG